VHHFPHGPAEALDGREGEVARRPVCFGIGLCDNLDLMDFVMWDMTGDFGRWTGRIGDRGGRLSNSSRGLG
jgi:hypothetical protein